MNDLAKTPAPVGNIVRAKVASFRDDNGQVGNTIVKFDRIRGEIRSMLTDVPLSEKKGELYGMPCKVGEHPDGKAIWGKAIRLTALGYDKLNQFAGVLRHDPETIRLSDGEVKRNPYIHFVNDLPLYVEVLCMGAGRNSVGNMVLITNTLHFDLRGYFARDVYAKWFNKKSGVGASWGKVFQACRVPDDLLKDPTKYVVTMPTGMVLVCEINSGEFLKVMQEQNERVRFAERTAQSICWRNVLKKYFGVTTPNERYDRENNFLGYYVPVVSWPMLDRDYAAAAELVAEAKTGTVIAEGDGDAPAKTAVTVDETRDVVDDPEDVDADLAAENDGEREPIETESAEPESVAPKQAAEPEGDPLKSMRERLRELAEKVGNYAPVIFNNRGLVGGWADVLACESAAKLQILIDDMEGQLKSKGRKRSSGDGQGNLI